MSTDKTIGQAQRAVYWGRYQWLQELWRLGERLTLERWGRLSPSSSYGEGDLMGAEREMRQLGQELEALLVGFGVAR